MLDRSDSKSSGEGKNKMKGIWKGENDPVFGLINGKEYDILGEDEELKGMFGVVDETGESYLYPAEDFEITEE